MADIFSIIDATLDLDKLSPLDKLKAMLLSIHDSSLLTQDYSLVVDAKRRLKKIELGLFPEPDETLEILSEKDKKVQELNGSVKRFHILAAEQYENKGDLVKAAEHYASSGDFPKTVELLLKEGSEKSISSATTNMFFHGIDVKRAAELVFGGSNFKELSQQINILIKDYERKHFALYDLLSEVKEDTLSVLEFILWRKNSSNPITPILETTMKVFYSAVLEDVRSTIAVKEGFDNIPDTDSLWELCSGRDYIKRSDYFCREYYMTLDNLLNGVGFCSDPEILQFGLDLNSLRYVNPDERQDKEMELKGRLGEKGVAEYFIAKIIPGQTTTTDQDDSGGDTKALPEYKVRGYAERGMYFSLVDGNAGVALDLLNRFFNPGCPTRALLLKAMGETELLLSDYRETNSPLDYAYLRAGFEPK